MKIIRILSLLVTGLFFVNYAHAEDKNICQGPLITMSAIGEIESIPDVAEISLNVKSQAKDETSALRELSINIEKIITVLENLKIKDEDIRTDSISLRPVYDPRNRQEIIAYAGKSNIHFKTFDLTKITDLMSGVMAGSDNLFSNISYSSTNKKNLEDMARIAAFKKAQHKVELYAKLSGNKIASICTINEGNVRVTRRRVDMMRQETLAFSSPPTDISIAIKPGKIKTTAQVTLVYKLDN